MTSYALGRVAQCRVASLLACLACNSCLVCFRTCSASQVLALAAAWSRPWYMAAAARCRLEMGGQGLQVSSMRTPVTVSRYKCYASA